MITGFFLGAIVTLAVVVIWAWKWNKDRAQKGLYAYANYDEKEKHWRVYGNYSGIAQKLADIRAKRQPGAIKYVD